MNSSEQKIEMKENNTEQIIGTTNENAELEKERMDEMSSSMDSKNASAEIENSGQQKSIKKRLKFGGWLPDCLDWFKQPELAQTSLPTSSYIFNRYCWPHLHGRKVKPRIVPRLKFFRERDDAGNWQTILEKDFRIRIPIADINPPEYIIGFEQIDFNILNNQVLHFMENILPLLNKVKINFFVDHISLDYFTQNEQIKRLMEMLASKTNKLEMSETDYYDLNKFNKQFPNFNSLQSIRLFGRKETDKDLIVKWKWLTTPREDGKPKIFEIFAVEYSYPVEVLIDRVKEEFVHSTEPANFIIRIFMKLRRPIQRDDFKTENETTEEMLELQREGPNYFLVRYKNDGETTPKLDYWKKQIKLKSKTMIWIAKPMEK